MNIVTVEQLAARIRTLLQSDPLLTDVWVSAEISNLSRPASGHCYFTLKDEAAQIRCALFKQKARAQYVAALQNGAQVLAHGYVSFYEVRGDLQLYVDAVQPAGIGLLQAEFERLSARLEAEGLFADERKRPLPRFPRCIGVVTSPTGAVFQDICHVIERRWPLAQLVLAPTLVQGDGAAAGISQAIVALNRRNDIDVIIVARGGGSIEDLWAFNEESVARAIFASRIPVISAVGHETDYTIADFVCDVRAPTPSAAAVIAVPDQVEIAMRLGSLSSALGSVMHRALDEFLSALSDVRAELRHCRPSPANMKERVDMLIDDAGQHLNHALEMQGERLEGRQRQLLTLSPLATLQRGYALVSTAEGGNVVRSTAQVHPGQSISVRLSDGEFGAQVERGKTVHKDAALAGDLQNPKLL